MSTCVEDYKRETKAASSSNKPVIGNDSVFVVPSVPDHLVHSNTSQHASSVASSSPAAASVQPRKAATPKQPFPDQHLPFVLQQITTLQTGSFNFLVETIHRDLREHNVKKNMIEAKVREVGEKCKEKKFWIVKPGIQVSCQPLQRCQYSNNFRVVDPILIIIVYAHLILSLIFHVLSLFHDATVVLQI